MELTIERGSSIPSVTIGDVNPGVPPFYRHPCDLLSKPFRARAAERGLAVAACMIARHYCVKHMSLGLLT